MRCRHYHGAKKVATYYDNALKALKADIGSQVRSINAWDTVLIRLRDPEPNELARVTQRRTEHLLLVGGAKERIEQVNALYNAVQDCVDPRKRAIGFVLHCELIEASSGSNEFTKDWALIELYDDMIDWDTFRGNQVYVGMSLLHIFFLFDLFSIFLFHSCEDHGFPIWQDHVAPAC